LVSPDVIEIVLDAALSLQLVLEAGTALHERALQLAADLGLTAT
jgi:hypothetical protein